MQTHFWVQRGEIVEFCFLFVGLRKLIGIQENSSFSAKGIRLPEKKFVCFFGPEIQTKTLHLR